MPQIKLKTIVNKNFGTHLNRIGAGCTKIGAIFKLKTIRNQINQEAEKYVEIEKELIEQFAKKNEAGKVDFKQSPEGPWFEFSDAVAAEAYSAKKKELGETEFELCHTLKASDFNADFLNADDVTYLDGIIIEG